MIGARRLLAASGAAAFSPDDVSGLELWLDADDATTFTFSSSTLVSQWDDKSGNSRHVSQSTVSKQPSRSSTYGSRTGVNFFGPSAQIMRTASATTLTQPYTMFAVSAILGSTRSAARLFAHYSTIGVQFVHGEVSANYSAYAGTAFVASGSVPSTGVLQQGTAYINGSSSYTRSNGSAGSTGNAGSNSLDLATIGASGNNSNYFTGDIAELLVYSGTLSTSDRDAIEAYLKDKWSTP